ncbi:hypothetical protein TrST_g13506 [Triparma strigata]|uniref:Polysaccharide biosynthesis domain-containing protein n=1 Tax=Triparma strigata TaxID=1606541 RepID=A0A9W7A892_9STRA|nr:hypothetical protein TrST_g13506 [Triparma strigata]
MSTRNIRSGSPESLARFPAPQSPPPLGSRKSNYALVKSKRRIGKQRLIAIFLVIYLSCFVLFTAFKRGGIEAYDFEHAARLKNKRGVAPPIDMQMGLSQIESVMASLPPEGGNLLVFGLGNDSSFWHDVSGGVVSFIEGDFADSKWATEWSDQVLFKYPYLDCSMVVYSTSMENDYERFERGGEALWAKELDLTSQLPLHITTTKWDVIVVDAPRGNKGSNGPGRFQSIYTARILAGLGTTIVIDDYERDIENRFSKLILGKEPVKVEKRSGRRGIGDANWQAYFEM